MAYEVVHKSQNECLIKYVVEDEPDGKFWLEFLLVGVAVLALLGGTDLLIVIIGFVIISAAIIKNKPRRTAFEVELNRKQKLVSIRSNQTGVATLRTYPLENFKGFKSVESLRAKRKKKNGPFVELYLKFDDDIDGRFIEAKNSLLKLGVLKTKHDGDVFWQVPLQKIRHPTPVDNANKVIASVDDWLGPKVIEDSANEPPAIIRDLRDMQEIE